jgi:hypothetical protein
MITLVITSCGRLELLQRTIESFMKFNTAPISEVIIIEDSCDMSVIKRIRELYPDFHLIANIKKLGQIKSIDLAYSEVKTPYLFHCEDDWEFYRSGFIEKSLAVLEYPKILTVWLREHNDTNTHSIESDLFAIREMDGRITNFQYMATHALGGGWHGFTWNPGLRRLSDYKLVAPFADFIQPRDFNALTEQRIGIRYFELDFRAAILPEGYCKHTGI